MITPTDFIAKWGPGGPCAHLNEEQGAQSHFLDLCELLGVPKPGSPEVAGEYVFERHSLILGEARGYADVSLRDHFAWENKAPGKNLDAALRQLQQYSLALSNPPLLVVCDRLTIRIHTQVQRPPQRDAPRARRRPGPARQANPAAPPVAGARELSPAPDQPRHHRGRRQELCPAGRAAARARPWRRQISSQNRPQHR